MILHFNVIDYINYYILSYFNGHRIMRIWLINLSALKWMLFKKYIKCNLIYRKC